MIDFSKRIKNGTKVKKIDPVEIYNTLDRSSVTGPLRPVQFNVLTKWHKEYRNKKDLIIKEALIKAHYNRVCRGNQRQQAKDEAILGGK